MVAALGKSRAKEIEDANAAAAVRARMAKADKEARRARNRKKWEWGVEDASRTGGQMWNGFIVKDDEEKW